MTDNNSYREALDISEYGECYGWYKKHKENVTSALEIAAYLHDNREDIERLVGGGDYFKEGSRPILKALLGKMK